MKYKKFPNDILSVDPGFNTGWAFWKGDSYPITGVITPDKKSSSIEKIGYIGNCFEYLLIKWKPSLVIIEDQWFNQYSLKSLTSVSSGAFKKLTWMAGALIYLCISKNISVETILPIKWKGNMNDSMVKKRVELIIHTCYSNSHIADAVGIGLHYAGKFINLSGSRYHES